MKAHHMTVGVLPYSCGHQTYMKNGVKLLPIYLAEPITILTLWLLTLTPITMYIIFKQEAHSIGFAVINLFGTKANILIM